MKSFIESGTPLFLLVLAAVITFCSLPTDARAFTPRQADYSVFENMLNADPGEDPHLKTEPSIHEMYIWDCEVLSAPPLISSGDRQGMLRGQDREETRSVRRHSRVNHKFTIILQNLITILR